MFIIVSVVVVIVFLAYIITYLLPRVSGVENVFLINMLSICFKQSESTFFFCEFKSRTVARAE